MIQNSCENDEVETHSESFENEIKIEVEKYSNSFKSSKLYIAELASKKGIAVPEKRKDESIEIEFRTNMELPIDYDNLDENVLSSYLEENINEVDGVILHKSNNEIDLVILIEDGLVMASSCENEHDGHCDDRYPRRKECSFRGIQQCVKHSIYREMNTFEKLICALEGWGCIDMEIGSCMYENCL